MKILLYILLVSSMQKNGPNSESCFRCYFQVIYTGVVSNDRDCNCDHCNEPKDDDDVGELSQVPREMDKEDADGDGNSEICAKGRDLAPRTFPSVCHMLCYNRCTRYNVTKIIKNSVKKHVVIASRTNYYKLRDGPCKKS